MKAVIDETANTIAITWNVNAASKYDNMSKQQLFQKNFKGWATKHPKILQKVWEPKFLEN